MMARGSTLNFKNESAAFAKALQAEHSALGDLLADLEQRKIVELEELVTKAKVAHEAVRFQRLRTEAARGSQRRN